MPIYLIENIHDLATRVMDWHQTVLERLDQMEQQSPSPDVTATIQTIRQYINPLPFTPEYALNQEVVNVN